MKYIIIVVAVLQSATARPHHNEYEKYNSHALTSKELLRANRANSSDNWLKLDTSNSSATPVLDQKTSDKLNTTNVPNCNNSSSSAPPESNRTNDVNQDGSNLNVWPQIATNPPESGVNCSLDLNATRQYPDRIGTPAIITLTGPPG